MNGKATRLSNTFVVGSGLLVGPASAQDKAADKLVIHADQGRDKISRNIYGQFSEHLGCCSPWTGC